IAASRSLRSLATFAPALTSNGRVVPSCWSSNAANTCAGSMNWLSCPTAKDWASASADWNRLVSLSIRIGREGGATAPAVQAPRGPNKEDYDPDLQRAGMYLSGTSLPE